MDFFDSFAIYTHLAKEKILVDMNLRPLRKPFLVILNGAKRSEESRIYWHLRDSSVASLPQNDNIEGFRRGLNFI